jgi:hemolysin activation/secretion protein
MNAGLENGKKGQVLHNQEAQHDPRPGGFIIMFIISFIMVCLILEGVSQCSEEEVTFTIQSYQVFGNTLLNYDKIMAQLNFYAGQNKTASDVEKARQYLEGLYHDEGYPTVLVNIPPQNIEEGIVKLEVIESTIGEVRVTGNRYYTKEKILGMLPAFRMGEVLYVPDVQGQINKANRNQDLKVTPLLMPGRELGTTDVELKVADHFPLHGSIELNNRSAHDTTDLRLNGIVHYDNLWQSGHSLSLQYQTSPQDNSEVKAKALSYVLPAPWNDDDILAGYAVWSDSGTSFGEGFETIGKGKIFGIQYVDMLPFYKMYSHSVTLGIDYKSFKEDLGYNSDQGTRQNLKTPITYLPLSLKYQSTLYGDAGTTGFSAGVNMAFRGLVTDPKEFEDKRFKARGNYIFMTFSIDREQKLPADFSLYTRIDGQLADQPLISNEQYIAGGMKSVRGYKESEEAGDDGLHWTTELRSPDLATPLKFPKAISIIPFIFYEGAELKELDPLPTEDKDKDIQGAGVGVRGHFTEYFDYEGNWGWALAKTDKTNKGSSLFNFALKAQF